MTKAEEHAAQLLQEQGAKLYRSGWPDFLAEFPDGTLQFVEVKSKTDAIQPHQAALHDALRRAGLKVVIIGVDRIAAPRIHRPRIICPGCGKNVAKNNTNGACFHEPCGSNYGWG